MADEHSEYDNSRFDRCLFYGMTCIELIYSQLNKRLQRKRNFTLEMEEVDRKLAKKRKILSENEEHVV